MVVVADAGILSATNLRELDEAQLRLIVGSQVTKAPADLASHFSWHGDAFSDGRPINTITPKTGHTSENSPTLRAEPVWDKTIHVRSWRAVWAYSTERAGRDSRMLTLQENRAKAVVAGEKAPRTPGSSRPARRPDPWTRRHWPGPDGWSGNISLHAVGVGRIDNPRLKNLASIGGS